MRPGRRFGLVVLMVDEGGMGEGGGDTGVRKYSSLPGKRVFWLFQANIIKI